jgi:hypothetical protein
MVRIDSKQNESDVFTHFGVNGMLVFVAEFMAKLWG